MNIKQLLQSIFISSGVLLIVLPALVLFIYLTWIAWTGFEFYLGAILASVVILLLVVAEVWSRLMGFRLGVPSLCLSVGCFLGAVNHFGWPWYVGVLLAFPGIVLFVPIFLWLSTSSIWRR